MIATSFGWILLDLSNIFQSFPTPPASAWEPPPFNQDAGGGRARRAAGVAAVAETGASRGVAA